MAIWRKKTVRHILNGKRCPAGTPGAVKLVEQSKRFYGTIRMADGRTKQVPLSEDREASRKLLRRLQTEADTRRALGIVDRAANHRVRPIAEHVADYEAFLLSKANTSEYVTLHVRRLRAVLSAVGAQTIADLGADRISRLLAEWRTTGPAPTRKGHGRVPISTQTSNHYLRACRGFSRWLWIERRASDDLLRSLRALNAKADRRHVRRAMTADELRRLVKATAESGVTVRCGDARLTPEDRAMLYVVAAYTGLRASELASLTPASFDLDAMTVSVRAAYSKHRRDDLLPLHASLTGPLRAWLGRKGDGRLWPGSWAQAHRGASILRRDLKRAGIVYRDESGRVADFHALRHTFVSSLARSGVHPSEAKALARHSTIVLTLDCYSHVEAESVRQSLNTIPAIA